MLQPGRILKAGHLHQDAACPLALDRRFGGAKLIDAAAHDLDRLVDRVPDALVQPGLAVFELESRGKAAREFLGLAATLYPHLVS